MSRVPPGVRAVFFDAVGTLIHPEPSAGHAYLQFGRQFGSRLPADEVRGRFAASFARQEQLDATRGHRTDEARELQRWREIVAAVLSDVTDIEVCFRALHAYFAQPTAWRVEAGAGEVLRTLSARGLVVGIASNFDHRLRGVMSGLEELAWVDRLVISSEVGWKKPAPEFFGVVGRSIDVPPSAILFVGDDLDNDYSGARAAGQHALLFDPHSRSCLTSAERLVALRDLLSDD
jgi:putative hydrolase of the HAD superfamily